MGNWEQETSNDEEERERYTRRERDSGVPFEIQSEAQIQPRPSNLISDSLNPTFTAPNFDLAALFVAT